MVSSAVSYPLVIPCTAVAVVAFMLAVIVPMFEQVYARMGGELPARTLDHLALEIVSHLCRRNRGYGSAVYHSIHQPKPKGGTTMDFELMLRLPVAGAIILQKPPGAVL